MSGARPGMPRAVVAGFTAAILVGTLLVAGSPVAAQDGGFSRDPQAYDSTPVAPVAGAESAFQDAAANWTGGAADPVGAAGAGDWTATDLSRAGSWAHGGSSGAFTYRYDLRVPPAAGPVPDLALSYSSASHDGRTSGTNNQASWIGDGWSYAPGFLERTYVPCADDDGGNQGDEPTGDLCWEDDSPSVTMALDGVNTSLVRDEDTGRWRAEDDANWRIEHLGSVASPGGTATERWVVTTTDGTRHYFGATSSSRFTVPVFGNHSGEPCHESGDFEGSRCHQVYRWMLDRTVDVHGNLVRYTYGTESGRYAPAASETETAVYVREGWLERVEYGLREGSNARATAKVEFTVGDRCLADCRDSGGDPKEDSWPDTPWDLHCESGEDCEQYSPAFFSTKRLTGVATYVGSGAGFTQVDSWALTHEFKDYGDEEQVVLWLASVQHTGHVGGTESVPAVEFGGTFLPNRVDAGEAWPGIWRPRLTSIRGEAGGVTTINYSEPDCGEGDLPSAAHLNSRLCYPARYTPEGRYEPVEAYFHKYVVRSMAESDATGGGDTVWTFYDYSTAGGGTSALWAWNDAEFVDDEARDWNQWRGYAQVVTRTGDPADPGPRLRSRARYFRGLDGDKLPGGDERSVSVTDSRGNTATDHRALAGMVWETASYEDTSVIGSETTWYWRSRTAVRDYDGGKLEAFLVGPKRTDSYTRLSSTSWRHTRTETSYDGYGRPIRIDDSGDLAVSGDEQCARTSYADNTDAWLLESVAEVETVSVGCEVTPDLPDDLIGAVRAFYDGHDSHTTEPTHGLMTRAKTIEDWDSGPVYVTTGESTYDSLGREVSATDAMGATSTTAYTPAGAGPVTEVVTTNPAGHVTTTRLLPAWGALAEVVSPNDTHTSVEYDPLGRRTAVWLPGQDRDGDPANLRFSYHLSRTEPTTVTTETMLPDESYRTEITLFDSLLRHRQTQAQTYGGRLVSQTVYDSYGRTRFSSDPVFNNDSGPTGELLWVTRTNDVARTEFHYDGAGRVTDEVFVVQGEEKWRTSYRYGGHDTYLMATTIAPEGGTSTATLTDAQGRPVELRQYHSRAATGGYDATRYEYRPGGQLARVTDPAGNTWEFEHDLRGREIVRHDPDAGTSTSTYNRAGLVTSTTNANGDTLSYEYDVLGRSTKVWDGAAGSGELLVRRTYDGAANGVGMPHTATRWVDNQAWQTTIRAYAQNGKPAQVLTYLPGAAGELAGRYWESFAYYPDGSMLSSNAVGAGGLAREPMTYYYNELGQPTRVTSSGDDFGEGHVYVDAAVYSPYGQLSQRRLGDADDVGGTSGQAWQTWIYEPGTGRLAEFYFDKDSAGQFTGTTHGVAALSYEYDDAGNVLSIADDPVHTDAELDPETQCFHYDHLRRLTEAWAQAGAGECATTPSGGVVGGPGAYWSSYDYDLVGNRVAETRWQPGGSVDHEYDYPAAGHNRPHSVTEVTSTTGTRTGFGYDSAGFTTTIDRDGEVDRLDWNSTGRLDTIETSDGVTRFYDNAAGDRVLRADPNGDLTAWVAGYELTYDAGTGQVSATRYYRHGGSVVGVRTGPGDIKWLASDHHGTNQWIVNGDTLTAQVRRYDPFGNLRGTGGSAWPDQRGFVGGIDNEEVGLTTVGVREYDSTFGRFLSRDPVTNFTNPQQLNGYAYANNNPTTLSDPSGLHPRAKRGPGGARRGPGVRRPPRGGDAAGHRGGGGEARSGGGTAQRGGGGGGRRPPRERGDGGAGQRGGGVGQRGGDGAGHRGHPPRRQPPVRQPVDLSQGYAYGGMSIEEYLEAAFVANSLTWRLMCSLSPQCPDFVRDNPPNAIGLCLSGSLTVSPGHLGDSACAWYTREDGIVYSGAWEYGAGGGDEISGTAGLFLTSAASAEEITGGAWAGGFSAGELAVGGWSGSYSDSGEWTVGDEVGVGVGTPAGGWVGRSETEAITHDDAESILELMWPDGPPIISPLSDGSWWSGLW